MITRTNLGGSFTFANTNMTVNRMGYGAMQLAGPQVWGPPRDPEEALKVLREALEAGVNHIDTSDFYYATPIPGIMSPTGFPYERGIPEYSGPHYTPMLLHAITYAWQQQCIPTLL